MHNFCKRLLLAADFVREGSKIVDIGTDHAYLPVYLISNNIAVGALACDLRKGPLLNAEKTVNEAGLNDKIELRLSDGLENVKPEECEDIILCGMGGTLITKILSSAEWIKDKKYRLILQPQSHLEEVRFFLVNNGFEIKKESVCIDNDRAYIAMYAEYIGDIKEYSDYYYYFGSLQDINDEAAVRLAEVQYNLLKIKQQSEQQYGSSELSEKYLNIINAYELRKNGDL